MLKTYFRTRDVAEKVKRIKENDSFVFNKSMKRNKQEQYMVFLKEHLNKKDYAMLSGVERKAVILWIAYWPPSAFWTILNDPIRRFCSYIYDTFLIGVFQSIHQKAIGTVAVVDDSTEDK